MRGRGRRFRLGRRFGRGAGSRALVALAVGLTALVACRSAGPRADLHALYDEAAQHHFRNPIVVIPGFLGTRLVDPVSERSIWGAFSGDYASPRKAEDLRLLAFPLTLDHAHPSTEEDPARGVLDRVRARLLGLPLSLEAYANILATLGVGGYLDEELALAGEVEWGDEHFTCFQFPYDWRDDNVHSAQRLAAYLEEKREYVERELEARYGITDRSVKFDLVVHSMGGLVARYFLRYGGADLPDEGPIPEPTWAGAELVERVVMVSTPNTGAAEMLGGLVRGRRFAPLLPRYPAALIATFPSAYQLLPRTRHGAVVWAESGEAVDLYDPRVWHELGWGLAGPQADRVLTALLPDEDSPDERRGKADAALVAYLQRAQRFHQAIDRPAAPPQELELILVAGDAEPTLAELAVERATGELVARRMAPGDGRVTRASALGDERQGAGAGEPWEPLDSPIHWTRTLFVFADHLAITRDPVFTDNLLYWLLEEPRPSIYRQPPAR